MSAINGLPSIPNSALPMDVRKGSAEDQKTYKAALGFEKLLLQTVVKDMTKSGGLDESPYAGAIEDSFSDALTNGGGLGLGDQLYHAMRPEHLEKKA